MNIILIIICSILIDTTIGNHTTTSTVPRTNTDYFQSILPRNISTPDIRYSRRTVNKFTPLRRILVPISRPVATRFTIIDSVYKKPDRFSGRSMTNNYPIHHVICPKISVIPSSTGGQSHHFNTLYGQELISNSIRTPAVNSFQMPSGRDFYPTKLQLNRQHMIAEDKTVENPNSIFPSKFWYNKFNTGPLSSNIGSFTSRKPINYLSVHPDIKSIKHNPLFDSASLTKMGNFVPNNFEQFLTNRDIPKRIRTADIRSKLSYPSTFNDPNLHSTSRNQWQDFHTPVAANSFPNFNKSHNYQLLSTQSQLHFPTDSPEPYERIRPNVDIINKHPSPTSSPENGDNSAYGSFASFEEENYNIEQNETLPERQATDREVSNSTLFDSYETIIKKFFNSPPKVTEEEKSDDNNEYEAAHKTSIRDKLNHENNDDFGYGDEFANFDNYGNDFNHDFEKLYHKKTPIEDFPHIKEVIDMEESVNKEKIISHKEQSLSSIPVAKAIISRVSFGMKIPKKESVTQSKESL